MSAEHCPQVDPEAAARLRLIAAVEEVRPAAKALGLDSAAIGELYAPRAMRVDAWLTRVDREASAWRRMMKAPLFSEARSRRVAR